MFFDQDYDLVAIWFQSNHTVAMKGFLAIRIYLTIQSDHAHIWIPGRIGCFYLDLHEFSKVFKCVVFPKNSYLVGDVCLLYQLHYDVTVPWFLQQQKWQQSLLLQSSTEYMLDVNSGFIFFTDCEYWFLSFQLTHKFMRYRFQLNPFFGRSFFLDWNGGWRFIDEKRILVSCRRMDMLRMVDSLRWIGLVSLVYVEKTNFIHERLILTNLHQSFHFFIVFLCFGLNYLPLPNMPYRLHLLLVFEFKAVLMATFEIKLKNSLALLTFLD